MNAFELVILVVTGQKVIDESRSPCFPAERSTSNARKIRQGVSGRITAEINNQAAAPLTGKDLIESTG